jgi:hypothetical protein
MHITRRTSVWLGLFAAIVTAAPLKADANVILITADEAKLPAARQTQVASSRAITRGPRIEIAEVDDRKLHSPFHFRLKFLAFGGSAIDVNSLTVIYLRGPNIDLTERMRAFIRPTGIDIPDAEVPPGEHAIRVDLKDSDGRSATANFVLTVSPN